METTRDTFAPVHHIEISQQEIDGMFHRMTDLYEARKGLADGFGHEERMIELEAIRDGILSELLEHNPQEAITEVVHSLRLLYENRSVTAEYDNATVTSFATRNKSNQWLDDRFDIIEYHNGETAIFSSFLPYPGTGSAVYVNGDTVETYTLAPPSYRIPRYEDDGSLRPHEETLRTFYMRTLSTAGFVLDRRLRDPEAADLADAEAKAMLIAADANGERSVTQLRPHP